MVNINGEIIGEDRASISINNRGFAFGDAVFETIRVINSKIIFWEDHYFRFMASMRIMRMEIPSNFSPEFLESEILNLIKANKMENAPVRVRFTAFRKDGGLYTPHSLEIGYTITAQVLPSPFYLLDEAATYGVELFKDYYVNSGLLSTIKTNNKAINILGGIFAKENGYDNCLLLNENKNVVEALNGNLFLVKGKEVKTPPMEDGCLNGIARKNAIDIFKKLADYKIEEASISPFELQKADELFITNVVVGVQPITKYRKKTYKIETAKELLSKLNVKARLS